MWMHTYWRCDTSIQDTGWPRLIGSPKLHIIFYKRATKYRSPLWKKPIKIRDPMSLRHPVPAFTYLNQCKPLVWIQFNTYLHSHMSKHICIATRQWKMPALIYVHQCKTLALIEFKTYLHSQISKHICVETRQCTMPACTYVKQYNTLALDTCIHIRQSIPAFTYVKHIQEPLTGWRRLIGSLIFIGHFPQKWPIFVGDPMSLHHPVPMYLHVYVYLHVDNDIRTWLSGSGSGNWSWQNLQI